MTKKFDYFVYEMMSIDGLDAPVLLTTMEKSKIFGTTPPNQFNIDTYIERRREELGDQGRLDFMWFGANLTFAIWYTRDLPKRHYEIIDKMFVLSEETKLGDGVGALSPM